MSNTFRLNFQTNLNQNLELSIPRANVNANTMQVISAMERIISSNAIATPKGRPVTRSAARLLQTEFREFDV